MTKRSSRTDFGMLFKKYRLRSEIQTLTEFGDLLAEEGIVYETSLFTKWQKGERIPRDRKTLFAIITIFLKRDGLHYMQEANILLERAGYGYLTNKDIEYLPPFRVEKPFQIPRLISHFTGRKKYLSHIKRLLKKAK